MSSSSSSRRNEILRAEESIRLLASEMAELKEAGSDLEKTEKLLASAVEAISTATVEVRSTRQHFDDQLNAHMANVQELRQDVQGQFRDSAERLGASIDALDAVRQNIAAEADRLQSIRGEITDSLQVHQAKVESSLQQIEERVTAVHTASEETHQRLGQISSDARTHRGSLENQLRDAQRQLHSTVEYTYRQTNDHIAEIEREISRLSSRSTRILVGTIAIILLLVAVAALTVSLIVIGV